MAVVHDSSTPPDATLEVPPLVGGRLRRFAPVVIAVEVGLVLMLAVLVWHATKGGWRLYAPPGSVPRVSFTLISVLGLPAVAMASAVGIGLAVWRRMRNVLMALFPPAAVILSVILESIVKVLVSRARPDTALLVHVHGRSFPSGHATAATALALTAAVLAYALRIHHRRLVLVAGAAYALGVCLARIALGVHYLTDVVAGAALAGAVVLSAALVLGHLATGRRWPHRAPVTRVG
jgi:membrane-associated phospholipid phosphatase